MLLIVLLVGVPAIAAAPLLLSPTTRATYSHNIHSTIQLNTDGRLRATLAQSSAVPSTLPPQDGDDVEAEENFGPEALITIGTVVEAQREDGRITIARAEGSSQIQQSTMEEEVGAVVPLNVGDTTAVPLLFVPALQHTTTMARLLPEQEQQEQQEEEGGEEEEDFGPTKGVSAGNPPALPAPPHRPGSVVISSINSNNSSNITTTTTTTAATTTTGGNSTLPTLPPPPPPPSPSPSPPLPTLPPSHRKQMDVSIGAGVGGGVALLLLFLLGSVFTRRRKKQEYLTLSANFDMETMDFGAEDEADDYFDAGETGPSGMRFGVL